MSLYQDIRGALQNRLGSVPGIGSIAYEGVPFEPTISTPYVDCVLVPSAARPSTMGDDHLVFHEGTFEINVCRPKSEQGTGAGELLADTIKSYFKASDVLTLNTNSIRIRYAERRPIVIDTDWIRVGISVSWYLYSQTY